MKQEILPREPLVSVVIPTYNRVSLLKEAIDSVNRQTYRRFEVIVVDDGSEDHTRFVVDEYELGFVSVPHCGRPGYLRNLGVENASGELLAFLDSDDLWRRTKLERQVAYMRSHPEIPLCHTRELWLRAGRTVSQAKQRHEREGHIFGACVRKCIIGPSTVIMRKDLFEEVGGFDPDLEIAEDYELWLRISSAHRIGYIDEPLVTKRGGHEDQLSEKYGQIEIFRLRALLRDIERGLFGGQNLILARREAARKCRIYGRGCEKRGKIQEAAGYFELANRFGLLVGSR
jgi:glycosyltransferase involved in cell wall biosynthesis